MPAIETVSGRYVDPEKPEYSDLLIDDMAWALSRTSRFAGHTITLSRITMPNIRCLLLI